MGSSVTSARGSSPEFLAAFQARAGTGGVMAFVDFMALALYDEKVGYYRRDRARVGVAAGTDFFTASTSGPVFGELVVAACVTLLGAMQPKDYTFIEIGAESPGGVLTGVPHPFAATRIVKIGEPIGLAGRCVVFSNELFDAQPFRRFVFRDGAWRELGVSLCAGELSEIELPPSAVVPEFLPVAATEGYVIDAPQAATTLMEKIAAQPWAGLFVACDYGKSWREIVEATSAGTSRAYYRHTQSNDLLARPGEQDLTCHVCWDWLVGVLAGQGFGSPTVASQESFFIRYAAERIAATSAAEAGRFSPRKLALLQLLHPSNLGQKFQVLHASR